MIGIYKITSSTGKIYIGQSIDIERRFKDYQYSLAKQQKILNKSFLKYGFNNHILEVIHLCDKEELDEIERYYQILFDTVKNGLNCHLVNDNKKPKNKVQKEIIDSREEIERRNIVTSIIDEILF